VLKRQRSMVLGNPNSSFQLTGTDAVKMVARASASTGLAAVVQGEACD
jgi:hypothetical protein